MAFLDYLAGAKPLPGPLPPGKTKPHLRHVAQTRLLRPSYGKKLSYSHRSSPLS